MFRESFTRLPCLPLPCGAAPSGPAPFTLAGVLVLLRGSTVVSSCPATATALTRTSALRRAENAAAPARKHCCAAAAIRRTPLLFLHGLMGSATNFNSLSKNPAVWPARQTCTMSLRNHGSSPNTSEPMTIQSLAADVALTLEKQLGQGPVHVVGHSLGGKVAMVLALEHPHLVEKLVVADIAPANYSTASPQWSEVVQVCEIVASIDPSGFQNRADCSAALADKGLVRHCAAG